MSNIPKQDIVKMIAEQAKELLFLDRIPDRKSLGETKLKEIVEKLDIKMLTPSIVGEVIGDFAFDEVLEKTKYDDPKAKGQKKLSELPDVDSNSVADKVYSFLSEIPQEYTFVFKLPKVSKQFSKVNFGYGVDLFVLDETTINDYVTEASERKRLTDLLSDIRRGRSNLAKGDVILTIKGKGYVGKYGTIKINIKEDPLYIFKVVIGVYVALGIIRRKKDADYLQPFSAYCYDIYNTKKEIVRTISESTEDAQYIYNLEYDSAKFELTDLDKLLKRTTTEFQNANIIIKNLFTTIKFAKGKTDDKVIKKQLMIKNGVYWFYEALKTNQDHIRAVYTTTSFDSLLNTKGKDDTKEYKASIVSNIIAKDVLESDGVMQGICQLYALRNEIVHGERAVYSLEKYYDVSESTSQSIAYMGLWYLTRFLSNRIYFFNGGLSRVINVITGAKKAIEAKKKAGV